ARFRVCGALNPPQSLLSWDKANVCEFPAVNVELKLSVTGAAAGQKPPTSPEAPLRVIVPVKSAPVFFTVRNPVSTDAPLVVPLMQTSPVLSPKIPNSLTRR